MKCTQCDNVSMFVLSAAPGKSDLPLCLDCYFKFIKVISIQQEANERLMNYHASMLEFQVGMPLNLPKFPDRKSVTIGGVTLNNIKIDNSSIGVLNTGSLEIIDSSISVLDRSNEKNVSQSLRELTEAIYSNKDLSNEAKKQLIDMISVISSEAVLPKDKRRSAAILPIIAQIASIMSGSNALVQLWVHIKPILESLFN